MADHSVTVENTLQTLLSEKKYSTIRDILVTMNPADIAAVFSGVEPEKIPLLFRLLPKELAAESFVEMESEEQETLIKGISDSDNPNAIFLMMFIYLFYMETEKFENYYLFNL